MFVKQLIDRLEVLYRKHGNLRVLDSEMYFLEDIKIEDCSDINELLTLEGELPKYPETCISLEFSVDDPLIDEYNRAIKIV